MLLLRTQDSSRFFKEAAFARRRGRIFEEAFAPMIWFLDFGGNLRSNKKLLGVPGLTTRSKDATRGSWHRY